MTHLHILLLYICCPLLLFACFSCEMWVLLHRSQCSPTLAALERAPSLTQSQYIQKVLQRFGMADCKPVATPLPEKAILQAASDDEVEAAWNHPYLQVIGSVMYAMLGTRPDIAYAISTLSHYASRPGTQHVVDGK